MNVSTGFVGLVVSLLRAAPAVRAQAGGKKYRAAKGQRVELRDEKRERMKRATQEAEEQTEADDAEAVAGQRRDDAERRVGNDRKRGDGEADDDSDSEDSDSDDVAGDKNETRGLKDRTDARSSERAQEMRARRDERKEIMCEYKGGRTLDQDVTDANADLEERVRQKQKGRKPRAKFWGD